MALRTDGSEGITLPEFLLRFFMAPAAFGAFIASAAALLRRRAHRPSEQRMSDEWLRNHPVDYRDDPPW